MQTKYERFIKISVCLWLIVGLIQSTCQAARLTNVRYGTYSEVTRVVLDLSGPVGYTVEEVDETVLRIRLSECSIASRKNSWELRDGRVETVEISEISTDDTVQTRPVLLEIRVSDTVEPDVFPLREPHRLVIDLFSPGVTGQSFNRGTASRWNGIPFDTLLTKAFEEGQNPPSVKRRIQRVVLDAGHGGFDSGAVNEQIPLSEKDVNLQIALAMKQVIDEKSQGQIEVFLTRTDDYYVTLSDRVVTANQYQADLFISIHCNTHKNKEAEGFELFFSSKESSDQEAAAVAHRENSLALTDPFFAEDRAINIEFILQKLQRHRYLKESQNYARLLSQSVGRRASVQVRPVKSADFFVLRFAQMPAILVETAFLSHSGDAQRLTDKTYHQQLAAGVYESIQQWNQQ